MSDNNYVELVKLTKAYPNPLGEPILVVDDVSLRIARGEVAAIIGHSGCGKSTVLSMIAGLIPITSGGVVVDGREIWGPGPDRAVVFQSPCLLPWMTAFENVMLGVNNVYPHATASDRRHVAEYYLALVGLADSMHKYPRELSQGMQQRVGIARAVALQPKVLLLDEPFGMLDSLTRMELQGILLDLLHETQATAVMVTHDVDEAILVADKIVMMTTGPQAHIGEVLQVPFARPRVRLDVLEDPLYDQLRGQVIGFLEGQDHRRPQPAPTMISSADTTTESNPQIAESVASLENWMPAALEEVVHQ
jgi:nitrate/nitrite transport system ATP-binding protein